MALVYERGDITCPAAPQLLRVHTHTPAHARTQNNVSDLRKMWFHPSHLLAALLQHECLRLSLPTTDSRNLAGPTANSHPCRQLQITSNTSCARAP